MMDRGTVRNLEQLREEDPRGTPRSVSIALVVLGCACVVFAGMALGGKREAPAAKPDPLGELVAQKARAAASAPAKMPDLTPQDVTFPGLLSDGAGANTTALAAVRGGGAAQANALQGGMPGALPPVGAMQAGMPLSPPAAGDRLPVVPLPAQQVLQASPVVTRPRDALTRVAVSESAQATASGALAETGHEGGYALQVSSFRTEPEARGFREQLRARGHKAYVVTANVPGRGTWHRVRIGPFGNQQAAASYRSSFEAKEHVVPFIVPPSK